MKNLKSRWATLIALTIFLCSTIITSVSALSEAQLDLFAENNILFYDPSEACGVSGNLGALGTLGAFLHSPINADWGISDDAVEAWYLAHQNVQNKNNTYGLNAGNIRQVTNAIRATGVSPALFWAYAVSEGGSPTRSDGTPSGVAGGFINNRSHQWFLNNPQYLANQPVSVAVRDASHMVEWSTNMASSPSWFDAGNPVHFVPQAIQDAGNADFASMPSGTIGRVLIPFTAAAAWEVYFPEGLKKEFNRVLDYGQPISMISNSLKQLGANIEGGDVHNSGLVTCVGMTGGPVVNLNGTDYSWPVPAGDATPGSRNGRPSFCHYNCENGEKDAADIFANPGSQIVAITNGIIRKITQSASGNEPGLRASLSITGDDGYTYYYTHMTPNSIIVSQGQQVNAGQPLATIGDRAAADNTDPHLHISAVPSSQAEGMGTVDFYWGGYTLAQEILIYLHNNR